MITHGIRFAGHYPPRQAVDWLTSLDGTLQLQSTAWTTEGEVFRETHVSMLPHGRPQVQYLGTVRSEAEYPGSACWVPKPDPRRASKRIGMSY